MTLECLLIADDLTGACDAAVQFAIHGLSARVSLHPEDPVVSDVLAVSTESRDRGLAPFSDALRELPVVHPRILFKKIDSTLRGNVGTEVSAVLEAFQCEVVIATPAFPALGRVVEDGYLQLTGDRNFRPQALAAHFPRDTRYELRDATCDPDLDAIVSEGLARTARVLWAGSAGLAAALARAIGSGFPGNVFFSPAAPIFCLGSDHPVTLEQQERLIRDRPGSTVRRIQRNESLDRVRQLVADAVAASQPILDPSLAQVGQALPAAAPLVLSGGDTASLVCRAVEIRAIDVRCEIAPGIPCGVLIGGLFDGMPVVTKSGGFGRPDALMQIADFFTCSPQSH